MKCLLILALAAAASASADPYMLYSNGFHHTGYYGYSSPLGYTNALYKPLAYHAVSPGVSHTVLHKREAEPYYHPYAPLAYTGYAGWPTNIHSAYSHGAHPSYGIKANAGTYSNDAVSQWNYAAKGRYVANSAGAVHIAKREAEPYYYGQYVPSPYSYFAPSAYSHYAPSAYSHYAPSGFTGHVAVPQMKTFSNDAVKPFNYAAKGTYHADSIGAKHIAKREAEPYYYGNNFGSYSHFPVSTAAYVAPHVSSYNPYTRTSVHVPTTLHKPYTYIKHFH